MNLYKQLTSTEKSQYVNVVKNYGFTAHKVIILKNTVANNNNVFLIQYGNKKFILRESNFKKSLNHLKLEVKFLDYLKSKKFHLTPYFIPNIKGEKITTLNKRFYTLQNFMPGETRASWNNLTNFGDKKLANFFIASAKFTKVASAFPKIRQLNNQTIYYYVKNGPRLFDQHLRHITNSGTKKLLNENKNFIFSYLKINLQELNNAKYNNLPKQVVHFDLHPGNVNFADDKVSGILDFDWIRYDNRLSDLAGTIGQSCYRYKGKNGGLYNKQKIKIGLNAYRKEYGKSEFSKTHENDLVRIALKGYMFFQLLWTMDWCIQHPHNIKTNEFIEHSLKVLILNDFDKLFLNLQVYEI